MVKDWRLTLRGFSYAFCLTSVLMTSPSLIPFSNVAVGFSTFYKMSGSSLATCVSENNGLSALRRMRCWLCPMVGKLESRETARATNGPSQ